MNHYDTLGIEPTATQAEIRTAYRRAAMRLHPDRKGASPESVSEFQHVQAAYAVLSDPERRARYDATGDDGKRGDRQAEAEQALAQLFISLIDQTRDLEYTDIKDLARRSIEAQQAQLRAQMAAAEKQAAKLRATVKRITRTTGKLNIIALAIEQKAAAQERTVASCADNLQLGELIKAILEEYEYQVDQRPANELPTGWIRYGSSGGMAGTSL